MNMKRREFLQLASMGSLLVPSSIALAQQSTVEADTQFGRIRGIKAGEVNIFKGVPYGASTAGENRFMPPQDPAPWREYREAFEYGPAAPQSDPASGSQQDGLESEDCLVLNVWTRGIDDGEKRPVMFWCHGGGFRTLSGSSPRYDGTNLAMRGDVVVVTINHRLNMMGFTHFGDMGHSEFESSGTVGMQDIVHALKWVQNNIEEFGGDPERVMIFGESGGGRKVATLLGMPSARGLFHRAVIESGATLRLPDRVQATELAQRVLDELEITPANLPQIQQLPLNRIMAAYHTVSANTADAGGGTFAPTMDGVELPYHPFWPSASPVNPDVPVIVGANRTEMTYFADDAAFSLDEAGMRERVSEIVGEENLQAVIDVYRQANPEATPSEIYFLVFSDSRYVMQSITIAERRAALGAGPTYLYYLTWETAETGRGALSPHTLDIPFIFDNVRDHPLTAGSDTAIELADKVSDTIIEFARSGDPNMGKLPQWQPYNGETRATMVWNDTPQVLSDPIGRQREILLPILSL
ncbi:MAG TPA: carboxylesterase/lipase family protein [Gammaproteobacteria bacterium]|jgi:para-nitrobenzyl esterase|nr:carboxylesterase family protein [Gammaproteobacteria bacterium]MDP6732688.1 carboxylesterase family protein [Gammaproteobacteria bacterium]HAJ77045.1 carboxylesterase/lipase family protein [Gammaproteobacteria bacterium]